MTDSIDVVSGTEVELPEDESAIEAVLHERKDRPRVTGGTPDDANKVIIELENVDVFYGDFQAVDHVTVPIREKEITAFIGPSGCGKSTVLRTINRMNDLIVSARVEGKIAYHGVDLYAPGVDPVEVRRHIGIHRYLPSPRGSAPPPGATRNYPCHSGGRSRYPHDT
jgi:phosphate transport system ATP-binding protein